MRTKKQLTSEQQTQRDEISHKAFELISKSNQSNLVNSENWKFFCGELWDETKVYLVDGPYVRNHLGFTEFDEGGHWLWTNDNGPNPIPKGEIWFEYTGDPTDSMCNLVHEREEVWCMLYLDDPYDQAHDRALMFEKIIRRLATDGDLAIALSQDTDKKMMKFVTLINSFTALVNRLEDVSKTASTTGERKTGAKKLYDVNIKLKTR